MSACSRVVMNAERVARRSAAGCRRAARSAWARARTGCRSPCRSTYCASDVEALAVAVERGAHVLGGVDLGALAAAPEHVRRRAELGGQVEVAHHLAQREPAHAAVVARERAVLEHRVGEQVRRHHRDDHPGLGQRVLEALDVPGRARRRRLPNGTRSSSWKRHPVRAQLGQPVHRLDRVERRREWRRRTGRGPASRPSTGRR